MQCHIFSLVKGFLTEVKALTNIFILRGGANELLISKHELNQGKYIYKALKIIKKQEVLWIFFELVKLGQVYYCLKYPSLIL